MKIGQRTGQRRARQNIGFTFSWASAIRISTKLSIMKPRASNLKIWRLYVTYLNVLRTIFLRSMPTSEIKGCEHGSRPFVLWNKRKTCAFFFLRLAYEIYTKAKGVITSTTPLIFHLRLYPNSQAKKANGEGISRRNRRFAPRSRIWIRREEASVDSKWK